jgi:hypothetical protein
VVDAGECGTAARSARRCIGRGTARSARNCRLLPSLLRLRLLLRMLRLQLPRQLMLPLPSQLLRQPMQQLLLPLPPEQPQQLMPLQQQPVSLRLRPLLIDVAANEVCSTGASWGMHCTVSYL